MLLQSGYCFEYCDKLVNVPLYNVSSVGNGGLNGMFNQCPRLSNDSLNNIMAMCLTNENQWASNKNLKAIGLSSTQATTCTSLSNWAALSAAGWTTGY